jgi:glycosyltransferase involved in cell wall biosynthesis
MLARFYTDSLATRTDGFRSQILQFLGSRSRSVRRLRTRIPQAIEPDRIKAFQEFGWEYALRLRMARLTGRERSAFLWAGRKFNNLVIREPWDRAGGVYVFNSAGLEILQVARQRGLMGFVEQTIAPCAVEHQLLSAEYAAWPGWESHPERRDLVATYAGRERQEWELADWIVCGSEFVAEGIRQVGGCWQKCVVVPYGVDYAPTTVREFSRKSSLNVLFAGQVGLRKGAPYFYQAAGVLPATRFHFRMVGPCLLSEHAARAISDRVALIGAVPRTAMAEQYRWADVLVLPSICEGSATVTYEALAAGVPVIATRNAGTVVRDGVDGFIVPARDHGAIAQKLELLYSDPDRLRQLSQNASARAREYTIEKYAERLLSVLRQPYASSWANPLMSDSVGKRDTPDNE